MPFPVLNSGFNAAMDFFNSQTGHITVSSLGLLTGLVGAAVLCRNKIKLSRSEDNAVQAAERYKDEMRGRHPNLAARVDRAERNVRTAATSRRWVAISSLISSTVSTVNSTLNLVASITQDPDFNFTKNEVGKGTFAVAALTSTVNGVIQTIECCRETYLACCSRLSPEEQTLAGIAARNKAVKAVTSFGTAAGALCAIVYENTFYGLGATVSGDIISTTYNWYARCKSNRHIARHENNPDVLQHAARINVSKAHIAMDKLVGSPPPELVEPSPRPEEIPLQPLSVSKEPNRKSIQPVADEPLSPFPGLLHSPPQKDAQGSDAQRLLSPPIGSPLSLPGSPSGAIVSLVSSPSIGSLRSPFLSPGPVSVRVDESQNRPPNDKENVQSPGLFEEGIGIFNHDLPSRVKPDDAPPPLVPAFEDEA